MCLVTNPKKIPMIIYTADYLINSYKRNHGNIIIDGLFVTKGCLDCQHPDLDEAKKMIEKAGIPVYINPRKDHNKIHTQKYREFVNDIFQPMHLMDPVTHTGHLTKHDSINNYFNSTLTYALDTFPNTEYVLFIEDDIAFYKNGFKGLSKLIKNYHKDQDKVISSMIGCYQCDLKRGIQTKCFWGYFAKLFNRKELISFIKLQKFSWHIKCGDAVECSWQTAMGKGRRLEHFVYHFGRDKSIKRFDKKFMK